MLLGADGLKAPKEDRQISVRYNRSMRGVAKIESTFEANGSDVNNNDVITYSVDFYPNKDSDEFSTIDKDNAESAVCYLSAAEEGYFIFRIEDEETDWQIDTYTGSAKITFVPTE
jgi:hypothetical protein